MADFKQVAIAAAVAILSALFVILLVDLVYPEPRYDRYCVETPRELPLIKELSQCNITDYGAEYNQCLNQGGVPRFTTNETGCQVFDRCDFCNVDYDAASKAYNRNIFVILGLVGIAAIIAGTMWKIEFLGTGIMFGGIIMLFYATVRYFGEADKLLRVLIVLVELGIVLWIGYKKLYLPNRIRPKRRR